MEDSRGHNSKEPSPTSLDIFTWKMNQNREYARKIISDYDYAKKEFSNAGVEIDKETHEQLKKGFEMLSQATSKLFKSVTMKPNIEMILIPES